MTAPLEHARSEDLLPVESPRLALIRFGSFQGRLSYPRLKYLEALRTVFGVGLHPLPSDPIPAQFELCFEEATLPIADPHETPDPTNLIRLGGTQRSPTITTDAIRAELELDAQPVRIRLLMRQGGLPLPELCVHLGVIIHKLLFLLDRVILHAAAVRIHDTVNLFVGEKGAGKSTICLGLARAGGTVLGEDSVVLRRTARGFLVSGGDQRSRVTEQTERHFFPEPLAVPARDFAGTLKKEIRIGDFFASRPFEDFPADRLLFPRVTGKHELRRLPARTALLRLMAYNGHFQRFAGRADQERFLDLLAGFNATVSAFDLELSHDLNELGTLVEQLRHA
jgi:hypothetical protein